LHEKDTREITLGRAGFQFQQASFRRLWNSYDQSERKS